MLCQIFTGPQFQNFILKCCFLKWQCHEINKLKWFCWKIRFYGDIREISDSAQANNVRNQTQCRLTLRGVEFFELNIRISPRKLIFLQNHFSLLIIQVGWIIEIKNCQQISWHCHFNLAQGEIVIFLNWSPKIITDQQKCVQISKIEKKG